MKKIELLSPVGDFECLKAAVQNGADSVYFGASNFNARSQATNFDLDSLKEAILYSKLRGVSTHLTLNTLIKDSEFEQAVTLAKKAYEFGIDAIIVQDLGLASYLIKNYPDLPIHASTQMTVHNLEGVIQAEKLGFKRVVLARELSLEEIEYICANSNIEIEVFIHGALCICYSGQCLLSSILGANSGNRGKCAQPCRLPYELAQKNSTFGNITKTTSKGYLLSTRDLCGLEYIPALIKAGVTSLKIEGRMKSPEYVATVTRIYRKYIDLSLSNMPYKVEKKDLEDLKQVFNRGNFSSGHFDKEPNKELVYDKNPSKIGLYIGNISNIKAQKGHVFVNLTHPISLGDSISFEKEPSKYTISELMIKGKNVQNADSNKLVEIGRMKGNLHIGDKVYRISSKELSAFAKNSYRYENRKVNLSCNITLKKNKPIVLTVHTFDTTNPLFENINISKKSSDFPIEAKSKPITKERIIEQLNKTSDTIFSFSEINVNLQDNLFLPSIKVLNELRRDVLDEIYDIAKNRILRNTNKPSKILDQPKKLKENKLSEKKNISVLLNILNENQNYEDLKNIDQVYIPLKYFSNKKYEKIINAITSKFDTYIYLPTIIKANYKNLLTNIMNKSIDKFSIKGFVLSNISNFSFLEKIHEKYGNKYSFIGNYTLNIYNEYSIKELQALGLEKLTISPELDNATIQNILDNTLLPQELIVYGKAPLMNINYCLLGKTNKCYPTCDSRCMDENEYYLKDRLGLYFRIIPDNIQTVSTIYNSKITSISPLNFNATSYRIDILEEDINQINSIVETVLDGKRFEGKEYTNANLNREI